jgi:hypothetical protein
MKLKIIEDILISGAVASVLIYISMFPLVYLGLIDGETRAFPIALLSLFFIGCCGFGLAIIFIVRTIIGRKKV